MPNNYTDYLGNPVSVGDTIIYPVQQGSSAANLAAGEVIAIEDIIPRDPSDPYCTEGHLHRDRNQQYPPMRRIAGVWDDRQLKMRRRDDKAYMLKVRRDPEWQGGNKQVTLKNVDRVVVVTRLLP
jgi:hypothetical protein